jgi:hypothetical protein
MFSSPRRQPIRHGFEWRKPAGVGRVYSFKHGRAKRGLILVGDRVGENGLVHRLKSI